MDQLLRRLTSVVIVITATIVGSFLLWDALAHLSNLLALPVQVGVAFGYGTPEYELVATVVLTTVLLSFLLGVLAVVVWVLLDRADSDQL